MARDVLHSPPWTAQQSRVFATSAIVGCHAPRQGGKVLKKKTALLEPSLAWKLFAGTRQLFWRGSWEGSLCSPPPPHDVIGPSSFARFTNMVKSIEKTSLIAHRDALRRPHPCEHFPSWGPPSSTLSTKYGLRRPRHAHRIRSVLRRLSLLHTFWAPSSAAASAKRAEIRTPRRIRGPPVRGEGGGWCWLWLWNGIMSSLGA